MMNVDKIEGCAERVYGYAVNHTFSRDEADELSQEILFTAVREMPRLKDESKFEPWLWGIAANITKSFRRRMGKQRAMYSYDVPNDIFQDEQYSDKAAEQEEEYDRLRTKIAMLSAMYRDIIILYYYDGLSTKQISDKLKIPEGTITWRLSEARKKLKKEYDNMNESALKPVKLKIDIYGNGNYDGKSVPFPSVFINDALSQNILYHCYEKPCSIEELAKLCGVPAYYIEDRMENLVNREAVIEASKGKYQTDFVIWSDKYGIYCEENAEKALLPIMDELLAALTNIAREAKEIDFYKAGKNEADLFYLYGCMAFSYASEHYNNLPYPGLQRKYDGYAWRYAGVMETGKHHRIHLCTWQFNSKDYSYTNYLGINGMAFRVMINDAYINACIDILQHGSTEDSDAAACAIRDGYIRKEPDGSFSVMSPAFFKEQKEKFDAIADKYLAPLMPAYSKIVKEFLAGYKKLFPPHLNDDADRVCQNMFRGFYNVLVQYAQRTQKIKMPSPDCVCDVLLLKS